MSREELKVLHDQMLAFAGPDHDHDAATCAICTVSPGGDVTTFTEEELQAKVDEATATLKAELEELKKVQLSSDIEAAKAAAVAEVQPKIDELQAALDEAVLKATAAETERDNVLAYLEAEANAVTAAAEAEARKEERLEQVRASVAFPEDYLAQHADRIAAMSHEDFVVALDGWKAISPKTEKEIPEKTALMAGLDERVVSSGSAAREFIALSRKYRVDPRSL